MRTTLAKARHHAPDPSHPGRRLRNSRHRERRIQQHIHPSYLHDAIFGPRHFAGHRIIAAEYPDPAACVTDARTRPVSRPRDPDARPPDRRIIIPLGLHHTYAPGASTRLPRPHATGCLIFDKNPRGLRIQGAGDLLGGMWAVIAAVFVVFQDAARLAGHVPAASAQADLGRHLHWPLFFWRVTAG